MGRSGVRSEWRDVPAHIREDVDTLVGSPVVRARNIEGGFSPGPAARCDLADGRTVFVKAAGTSLNPYSPAMHRREADVLAALPIEVPAPELIGVVDDGDWIALAISWVDASTPRLPLRVEDADRAIRLADRLAQVGNGLDLHALPSVTTTLADVSGHWRRLVERPLDGLDAWTAGHLDDLARLEADLVEATAGTSLVHFDLRVDNMLFGDTEADDVVVDWPGGCRGAPWLDVAAMLPSLHLDGGPPPDTAFASSVVGRAADSDAVDVFVAAIAGYFIRNSLLPPPPGLPTLREFQAAQGEVTLDWLRVRRGWD